MRRQLRRSLYLNLDLNLYLNLYPSLFLALFEWFFQKAHQKPFASLFGSLFEVLALGFWLLAFDLCYLPLLPPRRPVGRPLPGRIVVQTSTRYHIWCMCFRMTAPRMAHSPMSEKPQTRDVAYRGEIPRPWSAALRYRCR